LVSVLLVWIVASEKSTKYGFEVTHFIFVAKNVAITPVMDLLFDGFLQDPERTRDPFPFVNLCLITNQTVMGGELCYGRQ
jgi:hypothetical protein